MSSRIDGQDVELVRLFVNNAHLVKKYLTKYSSASNEQAAWTGATVQVAYCTDPQGDTVIASLGPFTLSEVGSSTFPGWYVYTVPASVTALLDTATYRGRIIYERITAGPLNEVKVVTPILVTEPGFAA